MKTAKHHHSTAGERIAWWVIALIVIACIVGALSACNGPRKTQRQLVRAHVSYPDLTAAACGDWYPVQTHDSVRIEYKQGKTIHTRDTVRVDCDEVKPDSGGRRVVYAPCPPCPTRTDTLLLTRTQVRENTARVREIEAGLEAARTSKTKAESGRSSWRLIALLLIGYTALRIALRVWLKISLP